MPSTKTRPPKVKDLLAKGKITRHQVELLTRVMHDIRVTIGRVIAKDWRRGAGDIAMFLHGQTGRFHGNDGSTIKVGVKSYVEGMPGFVEVSRSHGLSSTLSITFQFPNAALLVGNAHLLNLKSRDKPFYVRYNDFQEAHWIEYLICRPGRYSDVYASLFQLYGALLVMADGNRSRNIF